jgi:predicted nucleic acid-binding protein
MTDAIFIDTSAWVALNVPRDRQHATARARFAEVKRDISLRTFTSSLVIAETFAVVLALTKSWKLATAVASKLLQRPRLKILRPFEPTDRRALELLERHARHRPSLVDCLSFALMEEQGITHALAFDDDFEHAGFSLWEGT